MSVNKNTPRKRTVSKIEKMEQLLVKEKQCLENLEIAKNRLQTVRDEIAQAQKELIGQEFLKIPPDEFLQISKNLETQKVPAGEIFQLLANGDFQKLQEIYDGMKNADSGF